MAPTPQINFISASDALPMIRLAVREELENMERLRKRASGEKIFTINAVSKKLGRNFSTIKKYCQAGLIRTVPGGGIPESAITEYLEGGRK